MTDKPPSEAALPPYEDNSTAPLVYFDLVPAHGTMNGAVQIELASRILAPAEGVVAIKFMTTGRLRCTPAAAKFLRDAIDAALKMQELPQEIQTAAARLN
jgi:hypothetical protein